MAERIIYKEIPTPKKDCALPVMLTDETMNERRSKILYRMEKRGLDKLIVYCDALHAGNFMYLVGFYTRFEEALLVLDKNGDIVLMLGNENLNKASKARFPCKAVHVSLFSLPNQPNRNDKSFKELLAEAGIGSGQKIGMVGWKNMTSRADDVSAMFDIPYYIVDAIKEIIGNTGRMSSEAALFIGENGARTTNNANEIAHYEFGAALASDCVLDAMGLLDVGVREMDLGSALVRYGQDTSVTTIAAAGERFIKGNMFPTDRRVAVGVPVSLTVGYAGGSSSRSGYAVYDKGELPETAQNYMEEIAIPYFNAYVTWIEGIRIGMRGGELFDKMEMVLPRNEYYWSLCPGHLVAEEEWMSSPVYEGSKEILKSGMIFQIDIIPSKAGMSGVCAESTVVLADPELRSAIEREYPDVWKRMMNRAEYMKQELGIALPDEVLPMCSTVGYLRPYLLNKNMALAAAFEK